MRRSRRWRPWLVRHEFFGWSSELSLLRSSCSRVLLPEGGAALVVNYGSTVRPSKSRWTPTVKLGGQGWGTVFNDGRKYIAASKRTLNMSNRSHLIFEIIRTESYETKSFLSLLLSSLLCCYVSSVCSLCLYCFSLCCLCLCANPLVSVLLRRSLPCCSMLPLPLIYRFCLCSVCAALQLFYLLPLSLRFCLPLRSVISVTLLWCSCLLAVASVYALLPRSLA